jgi:hypothetical protein
VRSRSSNASSRNCPPSGGYFPDFYVPDLVEHLATRRVLAYEPTIGRPHTKQENIEFRRAWDARYDASLRQ